MSYAVLHITKYKNLGIGRHIDRHRISPNVDARRTSLNEEIAGGQRLSSILGDQVDRSRSQENQHVVTATGSLAEDVERRIKHGYKGKQAIRKDAVKALGVIMTGSHEKMQEIQADAQTFENWKKENYEFACKEFGKDNIVRFTLHMDERTPHFHCVFVPITAQGTLSAYTFMGGKEELRRLQDRYADAMQPFGLGRGFSNELTNRTHLTTAEYYRQANSHYSKAEEKTEGVKLSNVFRLDEVRKDLTRELASSYVREGELAHKNKFIEKALSSRNFGEEIKRDLEQIKREVNLIQHVASMGYTMDKKKTTRRWAVMEKGGDTVIIMAKPNDKGHWYYQSVGDSTDKGTIVDFMLKRGYTYTDIRKLSSVHLDTTVIEAVRKAPSKPIDAEEAEKLATSRWRDYPGDAEGDGYLQSRAISRQLMDSFGAKAHVKANKKGALFLLFQQGKACTTLEYRAQPDGTNAKYFQKGLPRGIALLGEASNPERIVIMESPIDALSYEELRSGKIANWKEAAVHSPRSDEREHSIEMLAEYDKRTLYIATCGSLSKDVREEVLRITKEHPNADVRLSFDNDEAGLKMIHQVQELLRNQGVQTKIHLPIAGKDFNDLLKATRQLAVVNNRRWSNQVEEDGLEDERSKKERRGMKL